MTPQPHEVALPADEVAPVAGEMAPVAGEVAPVAGEVAPVAGIQQLLAALQDPVRLEMVRRLTDAGGEAQCKLLYDGVSKSTAAHHFKILREAGITERLTVEGTTHQRLRSADVEAAAPGLLAAVVGAAQREAY